MNVKLPILALLLSGIAIWLLDRSLNVKRSEPANRRSTASDLTPSAPEVAAAAAPESSAPRLGKLASYGAPQVPAHRATPMREVETDAVRMLERAIRRISSYESLSADIRVEIHLYEQQLIGTGTYRQVGPVSDQLIRLDLDVGTGDSMARFQQVNNGRYLWIKKDFPSIESPGQRQRSVSRIDLRAVRDVIQRQASDWNGNRILPELISIGGLSQLLRELRQAFRFEPTLISDQVNGHPVWRLRGHWKTNTDQAAGGQGGIEPATASPIPQIVDVWLGQTDGLPYRLAYLGHNEASSDSKQAYRRMALWEIRAAQFGQIIDPRHFNFKHNDFDDVTMRFLTNLKSAGAAAEAP